MLSSEGSDVARGTKQARAQEMVRQARRTGALKQEPCELCSDPETVAHHDDYGEPLVVRWLCRSHHTLVHNALNAVREPDLPIALGPRITARKLRENILQIERPVLVYRLDGGDYIKLGLWIPAKALPAE